MRLRRRHTPIERSREFEEYCATRPRLFALNVAPGSEGDTTKALLAALPRRETVATLAADPWVYYALGLELETSSGSVVARIARCRVLRTREASPPALGRTLREVAQRLGAELHDTWLAPEACLDVRGLIHAPHGWRLHDTGEKRPFQARENAAEWVFPREGESRATASVRESVRVKFLRGFEDELGLLGRRAIPAHEVDAGTSVAEFGDGERGVVAEPNRAA